MAKKKVSRSSTTGNRGQGRGGKASKAARASNPAGPEREAERLLQQVAAETDEHLWAFQSAPVDRLLDREARRLDAAAEAGTRTTARRQKKRAPDRQGRARGKGATPRRARRA